MLSRGYLTIPSDELSEFVCTSFAQIEYFDEKLIKGSTVRNLAIMALDAYASRSAFACEVHYDTSRKSATKFIVNTFYKNKQKRACDTVTKDIAQKFKKRQRTNE